MALFVGGQSKTGVAAAPSDEETEAYTQEDVEAASAYNEEISPPPQKRQAIPPDRQLLDICRCGDNVYVLLEGGELWMTQGVGLKYLPSVPVWQMVHKYPWMVDHIKALPNNGMIISTGILEGKKYYFGSYWVEK